MSASAPFTPLHHGGRGEPQLLLHGFLDTWRTWELVLPVLEREREVLAPTLPGHAGGPRMTEGTTDEVLDWLEAAMDERGWAAAHVAGNSLGGYLALRLAERGRARSVVGLAPAGALDPADPEVLALLDGQLRLHEQTKLVAPYADRVVATERGLRQATQLCVVDPSHLPPGLIAHQLRGIAACHGAPLMLERARTDGWPLDPERITCPVRLVWAREDRLLAYPDATTSLRSALPQADDVVLDACGHCPQLEDPLLAAELVLGWP